MTTHTKAIAHTIATPDGPFTIIATENAQVLASGWTSDAAGLAERINRRIRPDSLVTSATPAAEAVVAYYDGEPSRLASVEVLQHGTELQHLGWSTLRQVGPGQPVSYAEFAELLERPSAVRAAAAICARNAAGLFVPCHRVLRTDGSLGGFAWGTHIKQSLLDRESGGERGLDNTAFFTI
ncbi:methylated-DNA--[protein]-cysteine S-methyltransferase [Leucobacter chinensis]|uniref:methylated-DNA--[protein]-cysteine S-methyltransferase n=1 Tax=Leucobacter chinensis TaxID=2851010 RepID=UPI001C23B284|nr:methylated-DNA--[protein]-cysteine S-methyltransferase [Leucobacter chinensis]